MLSREQTVSSLQSILQVARLIMQKQGLNAGLDHLAFLKELVDNDEELERISPSEAKESRMQISYLADELQKEHAQAKGTAPSPTSSPKPG
jgi:hypothetical protein